MFRPEDKANACIRCQGKVFDAEKVFVSHGLFHKNCFKCFDCKVSLDSTNVYEGSNEIFCKKCYGNHFGIHGFGYGGFGSVPTLTAGGNESKADYHFTQFF